MYKAIIKKIDTISSKLAFSWRYAICKLANGLAGKWFLQDVTKQRSICMLCKFTKPCITIIEDNSSYCRSCFFCSIYVFIFIFNLVLKKFFVHKCNYHSQRVLYLTIVLLSSYETFIFKI